MRADSLFKLRCVGLDPSEDRRVVDLDAAIEQHELQITVADGKHQIPSHGPKDHLGCELAPLEAITQTHSDARPIVPHSIIPELRQQRSLQQNRFLSMCSAGRNGAIEGCTIVAPLQENGISLGGRIDSPSWKSVKG